MKNYMRPKNKSRIPRSKMCTSCHKQVLLAGYDCHIQKCTGFLNHNNNKYLSSGDMTDCKNNKNVTPASMKDYESTMTSRNINLLHKVTTSGNTEELIACKYCSNPIPQKKYIKHITRCAKAMNNSATRHTSPTQQAYFKTGHTNILNNTTTTFTPTRQTPFELSKGRAVELMKSNAFIQEALQHTHTQNLPETQDHEMEQMQRPLTASSVTNRANSRPNSRPTSAVQRSSRPNSGFSRTSSLLARDGNYCSNSNSNRNTQSHHTDIEEENGDRTAQIELLERKIQEMEEKLSPKLALQHTIKSKILPFSRPKLSPTANNDKSSNKNNFKAPSSPSITNRSSHFSGYPSLPSSATINTSPEKLHQCEHCNRTFHLKAFEKHSEICLRVFVGKRPFFDSVRARLKGTPMEFFYWKSRRTGSGNGARRPRSAPKTRRTDGTPGQVGSSSRHMLPSSAIHGTGTDAHPSYVSKLPLQQHQQLQQLRSSTAPVGAARSRRSKATTPTTRSDHYSASSTGGKRRTKPPRLRYYSSRKNYGLFSLRLNLFETTPLPSTSAASLPVGSGGCRVLKADNWRARSRQFREAITAARVEYYSRQCSNPYKC